jgi:hypothetical protein
MSRENVEIVRGGFDAFQEGDLGRMLDLRSLGPALRSAAGDHAVAASCASSAATAEAPAPTSQTSGAPGR